MRRCGYVAAIVGVICNTLCAANTGFIPINDLGAGQYLGQYQGGLYPGGSNDVPPAHASIGLARAASIVPRNTAGALDPAGKYGFISIGMSNTTQEFHSGSGLGAPASWTFMGKALASTNVNHTTLAIVNGAKGGKSAAFWDSPTDPDYDRIITEWLTPNGLSEQQIQAAWVKVANPQPTSSLPSANADANLLVTQMGNITRAMKTRYPNLQQIFFSSRIFAGNATTALNPEPYAYESGFAVKRLIDAQINQMSGGGIDPLAGDLDYDTVAPWIAWGPYLWADGTNARSDGLTWLAGDFQSDGTHPSMSGEAKVADLLMAHMSTSPFTTSWFLVPEPASVTGGVLAMLVLMRRRRAPSCSSVIDSNSVR